MPKFLFNPFARGVALLAGKGLKPFIREQVDALPDKARVLTVGSGGPMGRILEDRAVEKGFHVTRFDIDDSKNPDIVGDVANYDFKDQKFDAVFMIEVLEHVAEMHRVPKQIHGVLSGNGVLVLSTPFIFPIHERPYDFYRYTRYGLEYLFRDFTCLDIRERNNWAESINVLLVRVYKEKTLSFRVFGAFMVVYALLLQPIHWLLGRVFKSDFMTSGYLMVAKK